MPIFITFPLEKEWLTVFPTPKLICSNFLHLIVDHWLLILDQNRSSFPPLPSSPPPLLCLRQPLWGNNKYVTLGKKPKYIDTKFEKSLFN